MYRLHYPTLPSCGSSGACIGGEKEAVLLSLLGAIFVSSKSTAAERMSAAEIKSPQKFLAEKVACIPH